MATNQEFESNVILNADEIWELEQIDRALKKASEYIRKKLAVKKLNQKMEKLQKGGKDG